MKTGFERTIKWNKCRLEMTNPTKTNNLGYLIDPTFSKVNILFVLSFGKEDNWDDWSFSKSITPTIERKDYNIVIDD